MFLFIPGEEEEDSGGSDDYSDYDIPEGLNLQNLPAGITVREWGYHATSQTYKLTKCAIKQVLLRFS